MLFAIVVAGSFYISILRKMLPAAIPSNVPHRLSSPLVGGGGSVLFTDDGVTQPHESQHSSALLSSKNEPRAVVAHVVSLIKCGKVMSTTGFLDAAAVLRHSIHKHSIHNNDKKTGGQGPERKSNYSYQMYAIVHSDCAAHAPKLEPLGYTTLIRDTPVQLDEIEGEWYRNHVEGEMCCGIREFIKLEAYKLDPIKHPIVIHWDLDVAVLQPLDDIYDAMLYPKDSEEGRAARDRLELSHEHTDRNNLPDRIDAFFTRDVTSGKPWEIRQGVQGGFLAARPDAEVFDEYVAILHKGDYRAPPRRGNTCGWGGLGYCGWQGALAYQGVVAYYYDQFRPNTAVELDLCRWNQVVADVMWRGPERVEQYNNTCRDHHLNEVEQKRTDLTCEDCRVTPIDELKTIHYTACKKPWECQVPNPRIPRDKSQVYRLSQLTNITTCMHLHQKWFGLRLDYEEQLQAATNGEVMAAKRTGTKDPEFFLGYCSGNNYIPMNLPPSGFDAKTIYGM
jgi:hypothetical protein